MIVYTCNLLKIKLSRPMNFISMQFTQHPSDQKFSLINTPTKVLATHGNVHQCE